METQLELGTRLSYSSATLLQNCESRYFHYKVAATAPDSDYVEDTEALVIGKKFHEVLEKTMHGASDLQSVFKSTTHDMEENDRALIEAMVFKYLKLHRSSGLTCRAVEVELKNEVFLGYVDAILTEQDGNWWIADLKTSARLSSTLLQKVSGDFQLNLYAYFKNEIAEICKLDASKFKGCRYRLTTKAKLVNNTKDYNSYVTKLSKAIKSYDIIVPIELLNPEKAWSRHSKLHERALALFRGEEATQNFSYCDSFFKPCPYWSQCHGCEFSKSGENLKVEVEE